MKQIKSNASSKRYQFIKGTWQRRRRQQQQPLTMDNKVLAFLATNINIFLR
jgi:hypothetical protein